MVVFIVSWSWYIGTVHRLRPTYTRTDDYIGFLGNILLTLSVRSSFRPSLCQTSKDGSQRLNSIPLLKTKQHIAQCTMACNSTMDWNRLTQKYVSSQSIASMVIHGCEKCSKSHLNFERQGLSERVSSPTIGVVGVMEG